MKTKQEIDYRTKSEKIISDFFKPYFKKYPEMESLWFLIYNFDDGIYLADEDNGINDLRWDELSDSKMYNASYKIQDAIKCLDDSKLSNLDKIKTQLTECWQKLQKDADDSNPLNKVLEDVWSDENREKLTKKVKKYLEKEIPWRYVDWCQCNVKKDGSVEIVENIK